MLASHLVEQRDSPEKFAQLLRRLLGKPLSNQQWPDLPESASPPDDTAVRAAFGRARAISCDEAGPIMALLQDATDQLNKRSCHADASDQGRRDWDACFRSSVALALHPDDTSKIHLYRSGKLASAQKKDCQALV